jgi:hypothetical protein
LAPETVNVTVDFPPNLEKGKPEPNSAAARQTRGFDRNPAMRASEKLSHAGWQAGGGCAKLKHREFAELAARSGVDRLAPGEGQTGGDLRCSPRATRSIETMEALHLNGSRTQASGFGSRPARAKASACRDGPRISRLTVSADQHVL